MQNITYPRFLLTLKQSLEATKKQTNLTTYIELGRNVGTEKFKKCVHNIMQNITIEGMKINLRVLKQKDIG